jgi:hypothetical protein
VARPIGVDVDGVAAIALDREVHRDDDHQTEEEGERDQAQIVAAGGKETQDDCHDGDECHHLSDREPHMGQLHERGLKKSEWNF